MKHLTAAACFLFIVFCVVDSQLQEKWKNDTDTVNLFTTRMAKRLHFPLLGIGPKCNGCPYHYCDDDPAIIHGYCCGCAKFFDRLPVGCSHTLQCPPNNYGLCQDYEYMMYCCC